MKKERLFSRSKGSLQETTSFHLIASQHRFAKRPKVEGGQSSWPKYIKTVHLVFCESFNGRRNKYRGRFLLEKRGDILDIRCIKDFLEPVCNETFGKQIYGFLLFFLKCLYSKSRANLPLNLVRIKNGPLLWVKFDFTSSNKSFLLFVALRKLCRDLAKMNFKSSQNCRRVKLAALGERGWESRS